MKPSLDCIKKNLLPHVSTIFLAQNFNILNGKTRDLPDWMLKGGGKVEPPDTEK